MPVDATKNYRWERVRAKQCAKRSYRVTTTPSGVLLRFCCPKGKWSRGRCKGGVKLQAKGYPKGKAKFGSIRLFGKDGRRL